MIELSETNDMDNLWDTLWKHYLVIQIIKNRYPKDMNSFNIFLDSLKTKWKNDKSKIRCLSYLNKYQDVFWDETKNTAENIMSTITATAKAQIGTTNTNVGGKAKIEEVSNKKISPKRLIADQELLADINEIIKNLNEILGPQNYQYVVIDDLDQKLVTEKISNDLVASLLNVVKYMKDKVYNLKIIVAVRTNLLEEVRLNTSYRTQFEKIKALEIDTSWSENDLRALLDIRINLNNKKYHTSFENIYDILPKKQKQQKSAFRYLLERTLMRPRDLISFLNLSIKNSTNQKNIEWEAIETAEKDYSRDRKNAIQEEWDSLYPDLKFLLDSFISSKPKMSLEEFNNYLNTFWENHWNIIEENPYLEIPFGRYLNANQSTGEELLEIYKVLYKIGFLGYKDSTNKSIYYHTNSYDINTKNIHSIIVHPMFYKSLFLS